MRDCLRAADASTDALRACLQDAELEALIERSTELLANPVLPEMYPLALRPLAAGLVAARGTRSVPPVWNS